MAAHRASRGPAGRRRRWGAVFQRQIKYDPLELAIVNWSVLAEAQQGGIDCYEHFDFESFPLGSS